MGELSVKVLKKYNIITKNSFHQNIRTILLIIKKCMEKISERDQQKNKENVQELSHICFGHFDKNSTSKFLTEMYCRNVALFWEVCSNTFFCFVILNETPTYFS